MKFNLYLNIGRENMNDNETINSLTQLKDGNPSSYLECIKKIVKIK